MKASANQSSPWWLRAQLTCGPGSLGLLLGLAALIAWCGGSFAVAAGQEASESQIKAAFLLNFPKYVEWPVETNAGSRHPIVMAILGDPAVAGELEKMIAAKIINDRPLILKPLAATDPLPADCQILFVGKSVAHPGELLAQLRTTSVLTVGDADDFLDYGGVIRFAARDRKIRLEINLGAATAAQLKISSKLLGVADVVKGARK